MRQLTLREESILVVTVVLVVGYLGYQFIVQPLKDKSAQLSTQLVLLQTKLTKYQKTIRQADGLKSVHASLVKEFEQNKSTEQMSSSILAEIEKASQDFDLQISDLKPQKNKEEDSINTFSVSLTINSDFLDIVEFLYTLQSQPYYYHVDEVRFDKSVRRDSNLVTTNLVLSKMLISPK